MCSRVIHSYPRLLLLVVLLSLFCRDYALGSESRKGPRQRWPVLVLVVFDSVRSQDDPHSQDGLQKMALKKHVRGIGRRL